MRQLLFNFQKIGSGGSVKRKIKKLWPYSILILLCCCYFFTDGAYHFVSNEEKVSKHAPKLWKSGLGEVGSHLNRKSL